MVDLDKLVAGKKYFIAFDDTNIRDGEIIGTFLRYERYEYKGDFCWAIFDCIKIAGTRWCAKEIVSLVC